MSGAPSLRDTGETGSDLVTMSGAPSLRDTGETGSGLVTRLGALSLRDTGETGTGLVTRLGAPSLQGHRRDRKWSGHQVKDPLSGVTHERREVAWSPCRRPPVCRDTGEHTVVGSQRLSSLWKETGPQR